MSDAGSVLPQEEIDEIFRQATGKSLGDSPAEPKPVEQPVVSASAPERPVETPTQSPAMDATMLERIMDKLNDLTQRIESMESEISVLWDRKSAQPDHSSNIEVLEDRLDRESEKIRKTGEQLSQIARALKGTPGYNAREQFTCTTCGSKGHLSVPMRCTECGTEGWWGWYPENNR